MTGIIINTTITATPIPTTITQLTRNMHVLVFDTDGVHPHLLGHKLDAVVRLVQTGHLAQLGHTRGTLHGGSQVIWCHSCESVNV